MAKATINTGATEQPVHTRTTADTAESQVVVLGTDGSDTVLDPATLATQTTVAAILAKLLAAPATEAKQDAAAVLLTAINGHVDGLEGKDFATQTTLAALLAKVIAAPATEAKQDTLIAAVDGLEANTAAATPAGSNVIGRVGHDTTTGGVGRKTVTTAGTQLALATSTPAKWVIVTSETDNTGLIAVGIGDAVAAAGSQEGTILAAGDVATLLIDNLSEVFVDCTVNGEGVAFTFGA